MNRKLGDNVSSSASCCIILPLDNEIGNIPNDTSHMRWPDGWLAFKSTADVDSFIDAGSKSNTSLCFQNPDIVASSSVCYLLSEIKSMHVV